MGDYPVDHHHFRHPQWRSLPDLHFYPVPSFNVPLGVMIPQEADDLIVAEKSVSVSNLINGATRLQPVVMQLGQAAGALAALAVTEGKRVKEVGVRQVQEALLNAGCYIMPYLDLLPGDPHFLAVQRIGATGILRGKGMNVGWANQTWFRIGDPLMWEEIHTDGYFHGSLTARKGEVTVGEMIGVIKGTGGAVPSDIGTWWETLGLTDYRTDRAATRLEAAVVIDAAIDPFSRFEVNYDGDVKM